MPTGGFSTQPDSIQAFSAAAQWIIALFMLIAGANFVLMLPRARPPAPAVVRARRGVPAVHRAGRSSASVALTARSGATASREGEEAIRAGVFQTVSIITTTGLASADFALWPRSLLLTLFALMFVGGSAGSTAGSIKVVRHLLLGKVLRRELDQTVSPEVVMPDPAERSAGRRAHAARDRSVHPPLRRLLGRRRRVIAIDSAITGAGLGTLDSLGNSATALGNVGPGFGITGPMGSFAPLGDVSKVTMIGLMWLGRLEIIPVVVLLTRHYWRL